MSFHKLPNSFFECSGRLSRLEGMWSFHPNWAHLLSCVSSRLNFISDKAESSEVPEMELRNLTVLSSLLETMEHCLLEGVEDKHFDELTISLWATFSSCFQVGTQLQTFSEVYDVQMLLNLENQFSIVHYVRFVTRRLISSTLVSPQDVLLLEASLGRYFSEAA